MSRTCSCRSRRKHTPLFLAVVFVTGLAGPVPLAAQQKEKIASLSTAEKARRIEELRAGWPKLEADYLALVKKARADLEQARTRYEQTKDVQAYQASVHRYHWALTGNTALGEIARTLGTLRELHLEYDDQGKFKRPVSEACFKTSLDGYHWIERNVWANLVEPVAPTGVVERGFLKKKTIKLAMCGDSITEYMDPAVTMLDYLDSRFEVLDCGLSGHTIANWFTSAKSEAVRAWQPDVIVMMLGTNATGAAMQDDPTKKQHRDQALAKYAEDLQSLRNLPCKPQVILVSVPPAGPGLWHHAVPAMWELQSHIAREHRYPFIDMSRAMAGLLSDVPNAFSWCPNRKTVGRWQHSYDDAHCSLGPALAKYYGLVCRQILEPERWYNLNLHCSAVDSPDWKEPWLLAQCSRDPVASKDRARGLQQTEENGKWTFGPHPNLIKRGTANGEVSFLRPRTGGDFYLMSGRTCTFSFGRPYQLLSDTPPADADRTFPAKYALSGTIARGDGQPAKGAQVSLGDRTATTDASGKFIWTDLSGDIVGKTLTVRPLP